MNYINNNNNNNNNNTINSILIILLTSSGGGVSLTRFAMTMVSMMTGWEAVPRVNCRPRGGCPVLTSKQWPSRRRYSSSYCAATTLSTWSRRRRRRRRRTGAQSEARHTNDSLVRTL